MAFATINKGSSYFNTVLYTGTGTTNNVTGVGFKPDFTWIKDRSNARDHQLVNAVVGYPSGTLISNTTDAEYTAFPRVDSSNADGFTVSTPTQVNGSGETYAAWNWLANNTSGSSNTSGTITSTVAANTTSGFSIVSYTGNGTSGATVGHGLGAVPKMMIVKKRSSAGDWRIYHVSMGNTDILEFTTAAEIANLGSWNNTTPTSSVFSLGNSGAVNENGSTFIAYCFAEVKGFSKFGSFVGNGSTNGTFVYTGFKPAFFLVKGSSNTSDWIIFDNKRDPINVVGKLLLPNSSGSESNLIASHYPLDFVSNGVKMRTDQLSGTTSLNASGVTYIYMAFAENPFVLTDGTPVTAR